MLIRGPGSGHWLKPCFENLDSVGPYKLKKQFRSDFENGSHVPDIPGILASVS